MTSLRTHHEVQVKAYIQKVNELRQNLAEAKQLESEAKLQLAKTTAQHSDAPQFLDNGHTAQREQEQQSELMEEEEFLFPQDWLQDDPSLLSEPETQFYPTEQSPQPQDVQEQTQGLQSNFPQLFQDQSSAMQNDQANPVRRHSMKPFAPQRSSSRSNRMDNATPYGSQQLFQNAQSLEELS